MKNRFREYKIRWKKQNIREQIFFSMLLLMILAVGILAMFSYYATRDSIEQNYRKSYEVSMKNSSRVLDLKLKSIVDKSRDILIDERLAEMLSGEKDYNGSEFLLSDQKVLEDLLGGILYQEAYVNSVALMDFYGHNYFINNIRSGTYEFCMTKLLNNPDTGMPMGCLIVNISENMLTTSIVQAGEEYETSSYLIVDEKHDMSSAFITGQEKDIEKIMKAYSGDDESEYMFSAAKNKTTGWRFLNVIEKNELSITSRYLRNVMFTVGGLLVILGFILARKLSETITKPLKQLEQTIEEVGEGERHLSVVFDDSEVGRIGNKFKEMVNINLELSEHLVATKLNEREAELLLLQSQINPHFLYNTLDSIYCVAMIHGDDQIAEMILSLSNNFKLSLNRGEKYITVENSVRGVTPYRSCLLISRRIITRTLV